MPKKLCVQVRSDDGREFLLHWTSGYCSWHNGKKLITNNLAELGEHSVRAWRLPCLPSLRLRSAVASAIASAALSKFSFSKMILL